MKVFFYLKWSHFQCKLKETNTTTTTTVFCIKKIIKKILKNTKKFANLISSFIGHLFLVYARRV